MGHGNSLGDQILSSRIVFCRLQVKSVNFDKAGCLLESSRVASISNSSLVTLMTALARQSSASQDSDHFACWFEALTGKIEYSLLRMAVNGTLFCSSQIHCGLPSFPWQGNGACDVFSVPRVVLKPINSVSWDLTTQEDGGGNKNWVVQFEC